MDKTLRVRPEWCKGCGICIALCPRDVLELDQSQKVRVKDQGRCARCEMCATHCPDFAIDLEGITGDAYADAGK